MGSGERPQAMGELIRVKHGFAFKGEYFTDEPTPDIVVTPGNFAIGGGFQDGKLKYYRGPVPEDYVLSAGDLIVTMTDLSKAGDTLGYPALVPESESRRYLHNQRIGLITINKDRELDKSFLFYRLRAGDYRHHVLATASGSTVRHTSPGSRFLGATRIYATVARSRSQQHPPFRASCRRPGQAPRRSRTYRVCRLGMTTETGAAKLLQAGCTLPGWSGD